MPLIDNGQLKQDNYRMENVIEVVVAVMAVIEGGTVEFRVATEHLAGIRLVIAIELDKAVENLHADDREHVV